MSEDAVSTEANGRSMVNYPPGKCAFRGCDEPATGAGWAPVFCVLGPSSFSHFQGGVVSTDKRVCDLCGGVLQYTGEGHLRGCRLGYIPPPILPAPVPLLLRAAEAVGEGVLRIQAAWRILRYGDGR